jgi:hypothetical protein
MHPVEFNQLFWGAYFLAGAYAAGVPLSHYNLHNLSKKSNFFYCLSKNIMYCPIADYKDTNTVFCLNTKWEI